MAKKSVPEEVNRTPKKNGRNKTPKKNSKIQNKTKTKTKNSTASNTKNKNQNENKNRNKIRQTSNGDASSEEADVLSAPSLIMESEKDDVVGSNGDEVERRSSGDEEEEEERETLKSIKERGKKDVMKKKGKRRSREDDDASDAKGKGENSLYRFPMAKVSRIIKSSNPDIKISQEAVFVINRASEKFLQAFCKEAYAHAFLDNKKHIAYEHLSTIVSRRERLNFLSDFIPEKVKAADAIARLAEAEKQP